jgi:hypothetical protein
MKSLGAAALVATLLLFPLSGLGAEGSIVRLSDVAAPAASPADEAPAEALPAGDSSPFQPGEQTVSFGLGALFPVFILPDTGTGYLYTGGSFSFSYQYFVANGFAIGGNFAGAFNGTIGGLSLFTAPLGFTAAYWWTKLPLEFCVLAEAGGYLMRYSTSPSKGIIDPFAKAGAGVFWRISPGWSVGVQGNFWFVPEIHYGDYASLSQYTGFVETSLSAVYHL